LNGQANAAPRDDVFAHRDAAEAAGLRAASGVTSPSKNVLEQTRVHFEMPLERAQVIANAATMSSDATWSLAECDQTRIAFIGRFDRHKGGDLALKSFARIAQQFPRVNLDFVGPDNVFTDESGRNWSLKQYLQSMVPAAARAGITCHGFLPSPKAAQIRKNALVTIVPSRYETFGLTAAEAMLAGCPLVVAAAGALTELVDPGRNGLVARAGDADDLAEKVCSLLSDPQRAASLGRQAAIDAAAKYAPAVVADATMQFYRSLLGK
jgi:glycosyltransferase involved in cell wall biosynthesis